MPTSVTITTKYPDTLLAAVRLEVPTVPSQLRDDERIGLPSFALLHDAAQHTLDSYSNTQENRQIALRAWESPEKKSIRVIEGICATHTKFVESTTLTDRDNR